MGQLLKQVTKGVNSIKSVQHMQPALMRKVVRYVCCQLVPYIYGSLHAKTLVFSRQHSISDSRNINCRVLKPDIATNLSIIRGS